MHTCSGIRKLFPILVSGLLLTVSIVRGDEPQKSQTTAGSDQYQGIAEVFSLISQEGSLRLVNRPVEKLSEFWIGVTGNPIDDVLRLHLDLPDNQGMLITEVIGDSPASKVGVKTNDVLVTAADRPIRESGNLAALIDELKETRLPLRLIRAGKPIIIEITPARRPASQTGETCPAISKASDAEFVNRVYLDLAGAVADAEKARKFVEDQEADKRAKLVNKLLRNSTVTSKSCIACHSADEESMALSRRLLGWHLSATNDANVWTSDLNPHTNSLILNYPYAGVLLTEGTISERIAGPSGLPDDVTITITRKGQNPAQITVRRGEQIWDADARSYQEKLPQDVRPYVDRWMVGLGESPDRLALRTWLNAGQANADVAHLSRQQLSLMILDNQNKAKVEGDAARILLVEQEVESLNQQLSQVQQTLEKLRKSLHGSTDATGEPLKK